jgi:hypothetical protein
LTARPPSRFTIDGDEFRHGTLNALDEFHCCRRVAPLVRNTGAFMAVLASDAEANGDQDRLASLIEGGAPLLQAFSELSDEDADFVIARCMAVTEAREGDAWVPTWSHDARAPALPTLRLNHLLRISYQVLRDALSVFFSDAASSLTELGLLRRATTP